MKKKIYKKFTSVVLSIFLTINPLMVGLVWADEVPDEPAEEVQVQEETSNPEEATTETETQGEEAETEESGGDSTITTGDAQSETEVETIANTHEDTVEGEITTPDNSCTPPEGETDCPEDVEISNNNEADVGDTADSSALTGENEILGSEGDALIDTGDATASASIENTVNINIVEFEDGGNEESAEESWEEQTLEEGVEQGETEIEADLDIENGPQQDPSVVIKNNNAGDLTNNADVLADTGENTASENKGSVIVETGDATALANLVNFLNANVVGSNFEIDFENYLEGYEGEINFNEVWKNILEANGVEGLELDEDGNISFFSVDNSNSADLENNVNVSAQSGENQANQNAGNATIETGDANALANVVNFINLNLIGSKFYFGVVNIFREFSGNLILPRPELFISFENDGLAVEAEGQNESQADVFENQNEVELEDNVFSQAQTGANESNNSGGDNSIETGDAQSQANIFSILNTSIFRNGWFFLIVNSLGSRAGQIFGWSAPNSVEEFDSQGQDIYQLGMDSSDSQDLQAGDLDLSLANSVQSEVRNRNFANLRNTINVSAQTGGNEVNDNIGNTSIETGNARSLANLFNFVNLNILASRWFLGVVNILGDWNGNTVFAYPDVTVGLTGGEDELAPGDNFEYLLTFKNKGTDDAGNVIARFELPKGVNYLSDTSGLEPTVSGRTYTWNIGNLLRGEEGVIKIFVEIDPDIKTEEKVSFWSWLVPEVHAAENTETITIVASAFIETDDPESDLSNNTASATTSIHSYSEQESEGEADQRQPILEITAKNNVNDFVYPGDIVTFMVEIKNTGYVPSYDTVLTQSLHNGVPGDFGVAEIPLGTIKPGDGGTLTFGMALSNGHELPEGNYHTIAVVSGTAPNGNRVFSDEARTDFRIVFKARPVFPEIKAAEKEDEVLGIDSYGCSASEPEEDILPYVLLLVLSSFYLSRWARVRLKLK